MVVNWLSVSSSTVERLSEEQRIVGSTPTLQTDLETGVPLGVSDSHPLSLTPLCEGLRSHTTPRCIGE
jgi:hypothetical protein